jgi:periplasmic divalent cation tolerance protein
MLRGLEEEGSHVPENSVRVNVPPNAGLTVAGSAGDTPGPVPSVNLPQIGPQADVPARDDGPVLIYATFPGIEEAERIGAELVALRLAACVNLVPGMRSIYHWQGRIERGEETVAIIKTRAHLAERVVGAVRVLHAYTNPALVVLPVLGGSADFLAWIMAETA